MEFDITVKERNYLNSLNQMTKKITNEYFLSPEGLLLPTLEGRVLKRGQYFAVIHDPSKIEDIFKLDNRGYPKLKTVFLYEAVRDHKKIINGLHYYKDSEIGFRTDEYPLYIGDIVEEPDDYFYDRRNFAVNHLDMIKTDIDMIPLSEQVIESLLNDELVKFSHGKYRVRLVKDIFPMITKKTKIYVGFNDVEDSDAEFKMTVAIEKDHATNYHVYTSIHY